MRILFLVLVLAARAISAQEAPVLQPVELEAFVDGYMASYLEEANIAGATVAITEGNEIVFAKGYGYADVEARTAVDPEATLFRIGSVSKLFVWTSVMQLVEQGKLDLLADVNQYLTDLEVPEAFDTHVNMVQLMTHTAGFDERVLGLFATDASAVRPLGEILRDELPARVRPPGEVSSYSNHGTALAMYVVEQISGMPWKDYIEQNILEPLDLRSTTFSQPLPDRLASDMSKGYRFESGELVEAPFEFVPLAPVGAAASSATDMARFMMAHVGLGAIGETRILGKPVARLMQAPLFQHHPEVNGMAHGLMELDMNGEGIVGHGGDTELFHTLLAFFPERGIGVFVSFNTVGANYGLFLRAFTDWLFPVVDETPTSASGASGLGRFAGVYRPTRYPEHTIAKIAALVQAVEMRVSNEHLVMLTPEKRHFMPVAPLVFRDRDSGATIAFREAVDGRITELYFSEAPMIAFERPPASEDPNVVRLILAVTTMISVVALLFWPAAAFLRWHYSVSLPAERRVPALGRWGAWLGAAVLIGFFVGISIALANPMEVVYGISAGTRALFWLPLAAIPLTVAALLGALLAWRKKRGSIPGRIGLTVVVLAMGLLLWQLDVWNLIGFNF